MGQRKLFCQYGPVCYRISLGKEYTLFGLTLFDLFDFVTAKIMLPLGGFFIALFSGWYLDKKIMRGEFTNNGTEPLILSNVRSSCGCTIPSWPREPIMPGKSSAIKVHYDTNRIGGIAKSITVSTNGTPERIVLSIRGTVTPKK